HVATIAALEARCAALSAKLSMINDLMEAAEQANKLAQEATEKLVQERNALSAENAGLKAFGNKLDEMHNELNGEGTGIQGRAEVACQQVALEAAMEEFDAIKTPATDAFLAEVRAQSADELAELYFTLAAHEANRYIADSWRESARFAKDHAAQLRKGVAQ
ncbi:TPA: hypothetical protein ACW49R_004655, partial [Salmonella enterica subsp. enterica serovar Thompson]